ncbi:MAG TPA: pilus assembly PilX N-terminal domain-containing protein [Candidatus Nanoarchaeia archaeon]
MNQKGQALIIMIVAVTIATLVLTSAILRSLGQAKASARNKLSQRVYYAAEAGAEHGLIKLMRQPGGCTGSDSLSQDSIDITITYNLSGGDCTLTSQAQKDNIIKKIEVTASYDTGWVFNHSGWSLVP